MPPASWPLTFWSWKWCLSHAWCGLPLCQFSLPRPLCSRLRPDVRDRQTSDSDVRRASSLNASALWGRGHNNNNNQSGQGNYWAHVISFKFLIGNFPKSAWKFQSSRCLPWLDYVAPLLPQHFTGFSYNKGYIFLLIIISISSSAHWLRSPDISLDVFRKQLKTFLFNCW